jgi:hypothetical protein
LLNKGTKMNFIQIFEIVIILITTLLLAKERSIVVGLVRKVA